MRSDARKRDDGLPVTFSSQAELDKLLTEVWDEGYKAGAVDDYNWDAFAFHNTVTPNPYRGA